MTLECLVPNPLRKQKFHQDYIGGGAFRHRTFGCRFLILFYFSSYEEKTMKQAIPWMPLSANLFRLESSILTRVKRATNRNNVDTETYWSRFSLTKIGPKRPGTFPWLNQSTELIDFSNLGKSLIPFTRNRMSESQYDDKLNSIL